MSADNEIVHMLGYLTPEQWADALDEGQGLNKKIIYELMMVQEQVYAFDLIKDVEAVVENLKRVRKRKK